MTLDGTLYSPDRLREPEPRDGMRAAGPDGPAEGIVLVPEFEHELYSLVIDVPGGRLRNTCSLRARSPMGDGAERSDHRQGFFVVPFRDSSSRWRHDGD